MAVGILSDAMFVEFNENIDTSLEFKSSDYQIISDSLESRGWFACDNFLSNDLVDKLHNCFERHFIDENFSAAKVGADKTLLTQIRQTNTFWIEDWKDDSLIELSAIFSNFMSSMNLAFFLSMKRWESQFASYPQGGFYKKHLDQIRGERHRQLTFILYLNDCQDGGELLLYDRENKNEVSAKVSPRKATVVVFFSGQIYHEVLPVRAPRYCLTTWFRDDLEYNLS